MKPAFQLKLYSTCLLALVVLLSIVSRANAGVLVFVIANQVLNVVRVEGE
jgi:hypothetical protein